MGNNFTGLAEQFTQSDRYSEPVPPPMKRLVTQNLCSPHALQKAIQSAFGQSELKFSYMLQREDFFKVLSKSFGMSKSSLNEEAEGIFQIFQATATLGVAGSTVQHQVINIYEFFSALILIADFSQQDSSNREKAHQQTADSLYYNAELLEHKINLILLLFDLRKKSSMNISEIIVMMQTCFGAVSKLTPGGHLFNKGNLLDRIRTTVMKLFGEQLQRQTGEKAPESDLPFKPAPPSDGRAVEGQLINQTERLDQSPFFVGMRKNEPCSKQELLQLTGSKKTLVKLPQVLNNGSNTLAKLSSLSAIQNNQLQTHETVDQKRFNLFQRSYLEREMLPLEFIKEKLLQDPMTISFLSLFREIQNITLVWGDNSSLNQGLHIRDNFDHFYGLEKEAGSCHLGMNPDKAVQDLLVLSQKPIKENDDILLFQALLKKWSVTLNQQRLAGDSLTNLQQRKLSKQNQYKRFQTHEQPTVMMCFLQTEISQVEANRRMSLSRTPEGRVFSLGNDFRMGMGYAPSDDESRQLSVPRSLFGPEVMITSMSCGRDHAVLLDSAGQVYCFGANQYGQLGGDGCTPHKKSDSSAAARQGTDAPMQFFQNPVTQEAFQFSTHPLPCQIGASAASETDGDQHKVVRQIYAGDNHSFAVTSEGELWAWGLATFGQLGVPSSRKDSAGKFRKDSNGQLLSVRPLLVTLGSKIPVPPAPTILEKAKEQIQAAPKQDLYVLKVHTRGNRCFAQTRDSSLYMWGDLSHGLSMRHNLEQCDRPQLCEEFTNYNFQDMALTTDSAVALGRSVQLQFTFCADAKSSVAIKKENSGLGVSSSLPATIVSGSNIHKGETPDQTNPPERETIKQADLTTTFTLHAIPVYDGELIRTEEELSGLFTETEEQSNARKKPGCTVALINEFQVPWVERANLRYPIYRKTIKLPRARRNSMDRDGSEEESIMVEDEQDLDDDDQYEEDDDEPSGESEKSEEPDSAQEDDYQENENETLADVRSDEGEIPKPKRKKKKKDSSQLLAIARQVEGLATLERRQMETHQFQAKVSLGKKEYFRDLPNRNQGIGEALTDDELSETDLERAAALSDDGSDTNKRLSANNSDHGDGEGSSKNNSKDGDSVSKASKNSGSDEEKDEDDEDEERDGSENEDDDSQDPEKVQSLGSGSEDDSDDDLSKILAKKQKDMSISIKEDGLGALLGMADGEGAGNLLASKKPVGTLMERLMRNGVNSQSLVSQDGVLRDQEQMEAENTFQHPDEPYFKSRSKLKKLDILNQLKGAQAFVFNYIAKDYRTLLCKILALVPIFPVNLRYLICWLPRGVASVDTYFARRIQQRIFRLNKDGLETIVLFIKYEDRKPLINNFYQLTTSEQNSQTGGITVQRRQGPVYMRLSMSEEGSLAYTWGSAQSGKLGIGVSSDQAACLFSSFTRETIGLQQQIQNGKKFGAVIQNNIERTPCHFTYLPQPVVTLLGKPLRQVVAGKEHIIALSAAGQIYAWGDNSQCQLGIDPQSLRRGDLGLETASRKLTDFNFQSSPDDIYFVSKGVQSCDERNTVSQISEKTYQTDVSSPEEEPVRGWQNERLLNRNIKWAAIPYLVTAEIGPDTTSADSNLASNARKESNTHQGSSAGPTRLSSTLSDQKQAMEEMEEIERQKEAERVQWISCGDYNTYVNVRF